MKPKPLAPPHRRRYKLEPTEGEKVSIRTKQEGESGISPMRKNLLFTTFLLLSLTASAAPLSFPDHNFSIEVPTTWTPINPMPPQVLAAFRSADNSKKLLVFATKIQNKERSIAASDFRDGVKKGMTDQGWQVDPEQQLTIRGMPFVSVTGHLPSGVTMTAYLAAAGDELYMVQAILRAGNAATDPEVQSVIQNFSFLSPVQPLPDSTQPQSAAFRAGQVIGKLLIFFLIAACIVHFIKRARSKRRNA